MPAGSINLFQICFILWLGTDTLYRQTSAPKPFSELGICAAIIIVSVLPAGLAMVSSPRSWIGYLPGVSLLTSIKTHQGDFWTAPFANCVPVAVERVHESWQAGCWQKALTVQFCRRRMTFNSSLLHSSSLPRNFRVPGSELGLACTKVPKLFLG